MGHRGAGGPGLLGTILISAGLVVAGMPALPVLPALRLFAMGLDRWW